MSVNNNLTAASMTTNPNIKYLFPINSGLIGLGVLPLVDVYGNVLTGTANLAKRLVQNNAPGGVAAAAVGAPAQNNIWTSFASGSYLNSLLSETPAFSFLTLAQTTGAQTGTALMPLVGNYASSTTRNASTYYLSTTTARIQAAYIVPVATITGTIAAATNQIVVTTATGTIAFNSTHHFPSGVGLPNDVTITGQVSGTAGGAGTYTLSATIASAVTLTNVAIGTLSSIGLNLTLPDTVSWRLICGRCNPGVGLYIDDVTSGATTSATTGTTLNQRCAPATAPLLVGGSLSTSIQGAGNIIAWAVYNRYITNTEMATVAAVMRAYGSNRGLTT